MMTAGPNAKRLPFLPTVGLVERVSSSHGVEERLGWLVRLARRPLRTLSMRRDSQLGEADSNTAHARACACRIAGGCVDHGAADRTTGLGDKQSAAASSRENN